MKNGMEWEGINKKLKDEAINGQKKIEQTEPNNKVKKMHYGSSP